MALVSLNFILNSKDQSSDEHSVTDMIIGLICLQVGEFLGAFGYILEEKILGD
jgi:hypothetical protein